VYNAPPHVHIYTSGAAVRVARAARHEVYMVHAAAA